MKTKLKLTSSALTLGLSGFISLSAIADTPSNALVMAYNVDAISTLDPAQVAEQVTQEILQNTCDGLVDYDPKDVTHLVPALAKSWDVSEDRKTITFHLQDNIVFPDGSPGTAKDLVWSMHRVLSKGYGNSATFTEYGFTKDNMDTSITAPDDHTVVFKMDKPYPANLVLGSIGASTVAYMLNQKEVEAHAKNGDLGNQWLTSHVSCVGPYNITHWNPGEGLILQANEHYNGPSKRGLPTIAIRNVTESSSQLLLLKQGDVDVARDLSADDLAKLSNDPSVDVSSTLTPTLEYIAMNLKDPAFANPKVRLAMRYLIDYQGLGETVIKNIGIPRASFVQLGAFGALDEKEGQPFHLDLDKAKQLLAEAGYSKGLSFKLLIGSAVFSNPIAQSIQENAKKIGVNIEIEQMANSQLFARIRGRNFQAALTGYVTGVPDAHGMASRAVMNPDNAESARLTQYLSWRSSFYNEEDNKKVAAALLEPDEKKRAQDYYDLQKEIMENGPMAYIMQLNNNAGISKTVHDWTWNSLRVYYNAASK